MLSQTDRQTEKNAQTQQRLTEILEKMGERITGPSDVLGDATPSVIFYLFAKKLADQLSADPEKVLSEKKIQWRRILNPIIKRIGPAFLEHKQVLENKNNLLGIDEPDQPLNLSKDAVIWCPNHGFKDDALATILVSRHAYVFFGSLPMFFNTFDGLSAFANGVVLCNRKVRSSKRDSTENAKRVLSMGTDLIIFPEGVWNKTPDKLVLNLWPGVYRIAKDTGAKIVPVIHYLPDPHKKAKNNVIHTVIADPVSMDGLTEAEGLSLLRDTMATWYYLLIEKYGQSTHKELLSGHKSADEAWENYLKLHTGKVPYYDREMEQTADYRPSGIILKQDVYKPIAAIKNITAKNTRTIADAADIYACETRRDFQRRF